MLNRRSLLLMMCCVAMAALGFLLGEFHERSLDWQADRRLLAELGKPDPTNELNCGACGYSSCRELASAIYRVREHPAVLGSPAMLWGYARSAIRRLPRYEEPGFREFLRRYQHACLRQGKAAATARLNEQQRQVWDAAHPAATPEGQL